MRRLIALVVMSALAACGPAPDADAGHDAGVDAWRPRDAARDVGHDASADSPDADAGDPWGWMRLGGLPDECPLQIATHPDVAPHYPWENCGAGCERLLHGTAVVRGFADDDGSTYYYILDEDGGSSTRVLLDRDGASIAIWEASRDRLPDVLCAIDTMAVGGGRAAVTGHVVIAGHPELSHGIVWVAPIADIGHTIEPAFQIWADETSVPLNLWVSATHVVVQTSLGLLFMSDGTTVTDPIYVDASDGPAQDGYLHDSHFYYEDWQAYVRLAVYEWGMPHASILLSADPADVRGFAGDGQDLAWLQGSDYSPGSGYSHMELWTSRYPPSSAAFAPRRVRDVFPDPGPNAVGGGWLVRPSIATGGFDAFALADGTQRNWTPPAGVHTLYRPQYALPHEVMVLTNDLPYRIDPTTLPIVP